MHTKYLGIHLDHKLLWKTDLQRKSEELNLRFRSMYWLFQANNLLSLKYKRLLYITILRSIWTYGISYWQAQQTAISASSKDVKTRFYGKYWQHHGTMQRCASCWTTDRNSSSYRLQSSRHIPPAPPQSHKYRGYPTPAWTTVPSS